ncbi:MAG: NACHT domain-containing protein [Nostoc sp.]
MDKKTFIKEINRCFEDETSLRNFFSVNNEIFGENFYQNLGGTDYKTKVNSLINELKNKELTQKFIDTVREEYSNFCENLDVQEQKLLKRKEDEQQNIRLNLLKLLRKNYLDDLDQNIIQLKLKELKPNTSVKKSQINFDNFTKYNISLVQNLPQQTRQIWLIIGEPYVGKTTSLRQLAKISCNKAEQFPNHPLPLIFELSRWNDKLGSLFEEWLIDELLIRYQIPKIFSRKWFLEKQQMVLFLDELDQLEVENRSKCVQAINKFLISFSENIKIVVSCSTEKYKQNRQLLIIERTTYFEVQPLQETQIDTYLDSLVDDKRAALRQLFQDNPGLKNFVCTPLRLKMMAAIDDIKHILEIDDLDERSKKLLEAYVDQQFKNVDQQDRKKYTKKKVEHWLSWLAKHMQSSIFLIEEMQPEEYDWLNKNQIKTFRSLAIWWHGLFMGLFLGPLYGSILHYYLLHLQQQSTKSSLQQGIIIGIIQGIINGPIISSVQKKEKLKIETYNSLTQILSIREYGKQVLKNMVSSETIYLVIVVVSSIAILCIIPMPVIGYQWSDALLTATIWGPLFGVVTFISKSLGTSFIKPEDYYEKLQDENPKPNQAIQELRNIALSIMAISSGSIYICYIFIIIVFGKTDIIMLLLGLITAVITGLVASIIHPSTTYYRLHYILRLVLVIDGNIPLNYIKFLEYVAQELTFMKRISGGYQFSDPLLKDYFKNLK